MYLAERSSKVSIGGDGDRGQLLLEQEAEGGGLDGAGAAFIVRTLPRIPTARSSVARDRAQAVGPTSGRMEEPPIKTHSQEGFRKAI